MSADVTLPEVHEEGVSDSGEERRRIVDLDVTIVCPVQTGDAEVEEVVKAFGSELERLGRSYEVLLVFDGVRGAAFEAGERLKEETGGHVRSLIFQRAFGESACLSAAVEHARGQLILTTPQYVQIDPLELGPMLDQIESGADFVTPWRQGDVNSRLNRIQSASYNWLMRRFLRTGFHDLNCYFRLIRREVLETLTIYGDMYRFLPVIAHRQGYKVSELRVRHVKEWAGAKFFGIGVYVRRFLDVLGVVFLTRFTHKPLRFFGTLGALFALLGTLILAIVFSQWLFQDDWTLVGRPSFFIAVMLVVLGVQIIGFGLVGEIIIYTQARHLREYRIERIYE